MYNKGYKIYGWDYSWEIGEKKCEKWTLIRDTLKNRFDGTRKYTVPLRKDKKIVLLIHTKNYEEYSNIECKTGTQPHIDDLRKLIKWIKDYNFEFETIDNY